MKTFKTPQVKKTKNYDMFEMHPCNRPLHKNDPVEASMRRVGFMPSSPLHCVENGGGKLKIIRGHHRFSIAKKLGIPVYYIIDDSNTDIFELEGSSTNAWNVSDFAMARARAGNADVQHMLAFKVKHGLTLGSASSLIMGQSAGSNNAPRMIKSGTFRVRDTAHAEDVVRVTDILRDKGVSFATQTCFVSALSAAIRIPEIDYAKLVHRASMYSHILSRRSTMTEYLHEIEGLYNYNSRKKLFPLALRAREVARERLKKKSLR